ncbi:DUF4238 domain-containing protein [Burkholderia gladioli]|uniref:DUF4238 domain-containing protein n=1 Tax=Burkholderia gladioli TaxID=28095 RepID=UPI001641A9D9|nr:DUF4238 domain-containing protein [Burkholderia gladioli]
MYSEKKNNQHYVGKAHLKKWQVSKLGKKKALWVHNKDTGNIFPITDLNAVGQVIGFYSVFVDQDIFDILQYRYAGHLEHPIVRSTLEQLRTLRQIHDYRERGLPGHEKLDIIENNYLENQYGEFETKYGETIDGIANASENLEIYLQTNALEKYLDLIGFYYIQNARTFAARRAVLEHVRSIHLERESGELKLNDRQREVVVKIMLFIDAIRNASEAQAAQMSVMIAPNKTSMDFVTSSTPACLKPSIVEGMRHVYGFLALSPRVAMFVMHNTISRRGFTVRPIETEEEVLFLNRTTFALSDRDTYSTSKEQLSLLVTEKSGKYD